MMGTQNGLRVQKYACVLQVTKLRKICKQTSCCTCTQTKHERADREARKLLECTLSVEAKSSSLLPTVLFDAYILVKRRRSLNWNINARHAWVRRFAQTKYAETF